MKKTDHDDCDKRLPDNTYCKMLNNNIYLKQKISIKPERYHEKVDNLCLMAFEFAKRWWLFKAEKKPKTGKRIWNWSSEKENI